MSASRPNVRQGMTLIEAVISMVIVGGLVLAAVEAVGDSQQAFRRNNEELVAALLAQDLMAEILNQDYEEPVDTPRWGRESSESGGARSDWDDVDDYDGWSSMPPEDKAGIPVPGGDGFTRSVSVVWADPLDLKATGSSSSRMKKIEVVVSVDGRIINETVAIRTFAWPPDPDTTAFGDLLLVVPDKDRLSASNQAHVDVFESWDWRITTISAIESQQAFDAAGVDTDLAFVVPEVNDFDLSTKLKDVSFGVVNSSSVLIDEFGFGGNYDTVPVNTDFEVDDDTHYITSGYALGPLTIFTADQPLHAIGGTKPDEEILIGRVRRGQNDLPRSFELFEADAVISSDSFGNPTEIAEGRRALLPWGLPGTDINALNADGKIILRRTLEWVGGKEQP